MAGIIEILGGSLYSRRDTAIRELLQNAHDAIQRRRAHDLDFFGAVVLRQDAEAGTLSVSDDGIGLSLEEAETYLGTLGLGISGLLKKEVGGRDGQDATRIIGQFGVGLFSAFLLADRLVVESRKSVEEPSVRWEAGAGTTIRVGPGARSEPGTTVTLHLGGEHRAWAGDRERLREAVVRYADFLPVPITIEGSRRRLNVMTPSWFEPTPDLEMVSMELEQRFDDTPLDVILVRRETPAPIQGALFISRQRTPGFSGRPLVTATCRRMVISNRIDGLFPEWGSFYRGVLELPELRPTTSREDLARDERFAAVRAELEQLLLGRLEELGQDDPVKLQSIVTWHRYTFAGSALDVPRLRNILCGHYTFPTSQGQLTFVQILERSLVNDPLDPEVHAVVWFNTDRRQEQWTNGVFHGHDAPCVQALRTFESTLLTLLAEDASSPDARVQVCVANPKHERFVRDVLRLRELEEVAPAWQEFFAVFGVEVRQDSFPGQLPVLAFPNDAAELEREFQSLKRQGTVPAAFSRMIERHFAGEDAGKSQVILNTRHRLVQRALQGTVHSPLASVLRLLVHNALATAGVIPRGEEHATILGDLDWIADTVVEKRSNGDGGGAG